MGTFTGDLRAFNGSTEFSRFPGGYRSADRGGAFSSLILDSTKGELVKAPAKLLQRGLADAKAKAALKSHSEAERRRRERINAHLATLRSLVPSTDKMDKASLLAEVITHVKELKKQASEASKGHVIPSDVDEVRVEPEVDKSSGGIVSIKASLCCEDRPELLSELKQTLQALQLKMVGAEISTMGGRMKNVFILTRDGKNASDKERRIFMTTVHQALKAVLDRVASPEFSPRSMLSSKRRRFLPFESSSSSS